MGQRAALTIAAALLVVSGCVHDAINAEVQREIDTMFAQPPTVEILNPEQLATVRRLAVMPFENNAWAAGDFIEIYRGDSLMQGRVYFGHDKLGLLLAERFEEQLLLERAVEVVERSRLAAVFEERVLAQQGVVEQPLPEVVAGSAGADAVLLGTITMEMVYMPDNPHIYSAAWFGVHTRLVDTRDGRILAFARDAIGMADRIVNDEALVTKASERICKQLSAAIRKARKAYPDKAAPQRLDYMKLKPASPSVDAEQPTP